MAWTNKPTKRRTTKLYIAEKIKEYLVKSKNVN